MPDNVEQLKEEYIQLVHKKHRLQEHLEDTQWKLQHIKHELTSIETRKKKLSMEIEPLKEIVPLQSQKRIAIHESPHQTNT